MADENVSAGGTPEVVETAKETQATSNPDLESARAELAAEKSRNKSAELAAKNQYTHFQGQYEEKIRSLQQQGYGGSGYQQEEVAPETTQMRQMQEQIDESQQEMGLMRYKLETPDWNDTWSEVQDIVNDNVRAQDVAVYDRNGKPDFFRSLRNAHREVELSALRSAKDATAEATVNHAKEQERQKAQATVSGVSASEAPQEETPGDSRNPDGTPMTSEQMLTAGLVDMDPNDPVRPRHSE